MRRLFWVGVGVAIGVSATRKVHAVTGRVAERTSPATIGASLGDGLRELGAGLGAFGAEVRAGMAERETELRAMVDQTTVEQTGEIPRDAPAPRAPGRAPRPALR